MQISVDEADVRCGGEDFVDMARALLVTGPGLLKRQPRNRWKWVSGKLKRARPVRNEIKRTQVSHREVRELRQLAQLGRQPFELVTVDLENRLERSAHDPINSNLAHRAPRAVAAGRLLLGAT
jgi:hypothetical protein